MKLEEVKLSKVIHKHECLNIIADQKIINQDELLWHEDSYLTLQEIYQQLKSNGYEGVFYVWIESAMRGTIYQCNNYKPGLWFVHGHTKGYA